jgi:hypothetical protein
LRFFLISLYILFYFVAECCFSAEASAEQLRVKAGKIDGLVRLEGHQGFCRDGWWAAAKERSPWF